MKSFVFSTNKTIFQLGDQLSKYVSAMGVQTLYDMNKRVLIIFEPLSLNGALTVPAHSSKRMVQSMWIFHSMALNDGPTSGKLYISGECECVCLCYFVMTICVTIDMGGGGGGGALPYKPIRDVPFFRVSFFSINF